MVLIKSYKGVEPEIHPSVFLSEGSVIIGDVKIEENSSVWFNTVIRGDVNYIRIGKYTNIQDLTMLHVTTALYPLNIGNFVTVGHNAVIHGATVSDRVLVGMGAIILDNSVIGSDTIIAAGSVIPPNKEIPSGVMVMGTPGKVVRDLTEKEIFSINDSAYHYKEVSESYIAT